MSRRRCRRGARRLVAVRRAREEAPREARVDPREAKLVGEQQNVVAARGAARSAGNLAPPRPARTFAASQSAIVAAAIAAAAAAAATAVAAAVVAAAATACTSAAPRGRAETSGNAVVRDEPLGGEDARERHARRERRRARWGRCRRARARRCARPPPATARAVETKCEALSASHSSRNARRQRCLNVEWRDAAAKKCRSKPSSARIARQSSASHTNAKAMRPYRRCVCHGERVRHILARVASPAYHY